VSAHDSRWRRRGLLLFGGDRAGQGETNLAALRIARAGEDT